MQCIHINGSRTAIVNAAAGRLSKTTGGNTGNAGNWSTSRTATPACGFAGALPAMARSGNPS